MNTAHSSCSQVLVRAGIGARKKMLAGFSLVELLVVVAIIMVIYALATPAVTSIVLSFRLNSAADSIVNTLGFARHSSIAQNCTVEVRFYRFALAGMPGEQSSNPATGKVRAIQAFEYNSSGIAVPLMKVQMLPTGIIFDSGSALSPLLAGSQQQTYAATSQVSLPEAGMNYTYGTYQIRPSGITQVGLSSGTFTTLPTGLSCITLHKLTDGDALSRPPSNYVTIQVDPISATPQSYKP